VFQNKIEIIVPHSHYSSYLESLVSSWNSNDLYFTMEYDHLDQRIFSAFSPHIENIKNEKELVKRILSLNILVNGALFVAYAKTRTKVEFTNYHIEDKEIDNTIKKDGFAGFWTDSIEEYPFENDESFYIQEENRNLPKRADLDVMLFSISKFDYIIRTLLYQAGVIFNNGINEKILTWTTLYKMVDTIKVGCKEVGVDYKTLIDEVALERFTAACNNPTILGVYARHGGKGRNITRIQPITHIEEAISLILCFANRFSKVYVTKKGYITIDDCTISKCEYKEYRDPYNSSNIDYSEFKHFDV
jgi:hypothetical protein